MPQDRFPGGVWPVMLTPFKLNGEMDEDCFAKMTEWYVSQGAEGLFSVCQSSEMYQMTIEEREHAAKCVVRASAGRVPVLASAAIGEDSALWADEVRRMYATGVDAIILITNQFAAQDEDDATWLKRCLTLVDRLPPEIPLGFYECPYPYKRLVSTQNLSTLARTNRFYFFKDTSCDEKLILERLKAIQVTKLKLYNANSSTLLPTLRAGAAGFSGVMANFHTDLYAHLCSHIHESGIEELQAFLTLASMIECRYYPVNAKYHMNRHEGIPITIYSRRQPLEGFTDTYRSAVDDLALLEKQMRAKYGR